MPTVYFEGVGGRLDEAGGKVYGSFLKGKIILKKLKPDTIA